MLLVPEDEDIHQVALLLRGEFAGTLSPAVITRIVWEACRELAVEVPRGSLAEFTHRSAHQRLTDLSTEMLPTGGPVARRKRSARRAGHRRTHSRAA